MRTVFLLTVLAFVIGGVTGFEIDEVRHSSSHSSTDTEKEKEVAMRFVNDSSKHFVAHCGDRRLQPAFNAWIEENFSGWPYRGSWAGCAGPFGSEEDCKDLVKEVAKFVDIAHIETVHLINHRDCKAHHGSVVHSSREAELSYHLDTLAQAATLINQRFPHLEVRLYFAELDGSITELAPSQAEPMSLGSVPDNTLAL